MTQFLDDLRRQRRVAAVLLALGALAVALGATLPALFMRLGERFPWMARFLGDEGSELGLGVVLLPFGMMGISLACLGLEAWLLGYDRSTVKRIILNDTPSVRTDVFYLLFRVSGLLMVFSLVFSMGSLYVVTDYIRATLGIAVFANIDNFVLQFAAWAALFTFLNYWAHRLLHTGLLWDIHQVHHSAEHYNVLLPYRNHPIEYIVATLYAVAATAVLGIAPQVMMTWLAVNGVYQSMVHSNADWKWRWVEWVLITPAAHRIHHSTASKHFNSNFGILSIWDRLFGTYVPPTDETINLGVPEQENFNTGRYFGEMIACLLRWLGMKRTAVGGGA